MMYHNYKVIREEIPKLIRAGKIKINIEKLLKIIIGHMCISSTDPRVSKMVHLSIENFQCVILTELELQDHHKS